MHFDLSRRSLGFTLLVVACLISVMPLHAQEAKAENPKQTFTGYPPAVYMHSFLACPGDNPCAQTENFRVDPVPKGCCVLTVTNGDGRGTDEVSNYEVFFNGQRVLPTSERAGGNTRFPQKVLHQKFGLVRLTARTASVSWAKA